jgi:hypothetical protein
VKRLSKVILIALAVLVALGAVTVGALLVYIRSDSARQRIEIAVTKALKTRMHVGKVELSSWNAIRAERITVPTLDESAALVSAPTFAAKFRYGPLLSGELELYDLVVNHAQVIWPQDAEGRWSWPALPKPEKIETGEPSEMPTVPKEKKKSAVSIAGMKLAGATIEFRDAKQQPIIVATGVDVDFTKVGQDGTEGQATITRLAWLTKYVFENVSTPFRYANGAVNLENIQAVTLGGNVRGTLQMNPEAAESPFTVHMELHGLSLRDLLALAGWTAGDISGKLSGQVDAKGTSKNFQRLEGPGRLTIEEGRFTRLPLLDPIAQVLEIPELSDLRTSDAFVDFKLRDEKAFVESLVLATPSLRLSAKGVSRFDNKLNLDATLTIADPIAKRIPDFSLQNFHKADEQYALEFKITGSNDHPKTDLAEKLIGGSVKEKVEDLLSGLFGTKPKPKEKEKEKGKGKEKERDPEKKKDKTKTDAKPETGEAPTRL